MGEFRSSYFEGSNELGYGDLQLFGDVIGPESDAHWRTEDPYTMTYELPRSVDEYSLPGNETADFQPEKPLNDWEPSDVMQWICEEYSRNNRDYETVPLRRFADVSVGDLRRMEIADFYAILQCQESAEFLHRCKERLFAEQTGAENWTPKDVMEWVCEVFVKHGRDYESIPLRNFANVTAKDLEQMTVGHFSSVLEGNWEDARLLYDCKSELFRGRNGSQPEPVRTRKRGRPRTKEIREVKHERRTGKLWEFLRNLLMDSKTCPSLIKWDNYDEGTFKFVQNEKVAKLWGDRKRNGKMNYEKFSRAMRYYYRSKVLLPVSGKRLVYKFGPNATGWRDAKPIL